MTDSNSTYTSKRVPCPDCGSSDGLAGLRELYEMAEKYGDVVAMFQLKHRIEDAEARLTAAIEQAVP